MAYTGAYVFGDSLVDSGNALKLAKFYGTLTFSDLPEGAPDPALGYFQGRFSNGYTFADLISNKAIGLVTKPVFPFGYKDPEFGIPLDPFAGDPSGNNLNFAYGGSQILQGDEVVPELDGQTDAFRDAIDGHAPSGALYMVTIGGNDVRSLAPAGSDPVAVVDAHAALDRAADAMFWELNQLVGMGARNFLITGVPDVGLIPKYDTDAPGTAGYGTLEGEEIARSQAATEYSAYLDNLIRTEVVPQLRAMGANVTYVPIMGPAYVDPAGNIIQPALTAVMPELAALHGLTPQQLSDNLLQYQQIVFFDQVHPTAQTHALVGAYMQAQLAGTPWIETMPLTSADVDYRTTATIGAAGEVDAASVYLVSGTTYRFEMLGISALGTAGSLADPTLRLVAPGGIFAAADDDGGAGFDASITFNATVAGAYTAQLSAVGQLTGTYAFQIAVLGGTAMNVGNTYTVSNANMLVIEGRGGAGVDVVKASVSYVLPGGSEIEMLSTTNDKGKGAINLTGNDFDQTIVGNSGANVLEGRGGADVMTGGAGNDTFVLSASALTSPGSANIDTITDYSRGDIVDVTQILSVAAGTNVSSGGYLRVTTSGLIQVDVDGGGDEWVTLSTVNGSGTVTLRYMSGGSSTNVGLARASESAALQHDTGAVDMHSTAQVSLVGAPHDFSSHDPWA